jgi:hypothetical protein
MSTTPGWERSESVVPEQTGDDNDQGWGDRPVDSDPDDLERFLRERPPHHDD